MYNCIIIFMKLLIEHQTFGGSYSCESFGVEADPEAIEGPGVEEAVEGPVAVEGPDDEVLEVLVGPGLGGLFFGGWEGSLLN